MDAARLEAVVQKFLPAGLPESLGQAACVETVANHSAEHGACMSAGAALGEDQVVVAASPVQADSFTAFLAALPTDERRLVCKDYSAFILGAAAWRKAHPKPKKAARPPTVRLYRQTLVISQRIELGARFREWRLTAAGQEHKRDFLAAFCRSIRDYEGKPVPKRDTMAVKRALEATTGEGLGGRLRALNPGGRRRAPRTMAEIKSPLRFRKHTYTPRGRLGGPLDERLWDWFVDIRASVLNYMPPKFLRQKAISLADEIVKAMARTGVRGRGEKW